ncbi:hypothetical protein GEMRC1_000178 [Eukaryota sp. GEM-RC1]
MHIAAKRMKDAVLEVPYSDVDYHPNDSRTVKAKWTTLHTKSFIRIKKLICQSTTLALLKAHKASTTTLPLIDELAAKTHSLLAKWEEAEKNQQVYIDSLTSRVHDPPEFKEGDLVLRIVEKPRRLHGRTTTSCSSRFLKCFHSSSSNSEYLKAVAALDAEETVLKRILDLDGSYVRVEWIDGSTSWEPFSTMQKTSAYAKYKASLK